MREGGSSPRTLSGAALVIALLALAVALSGAAVGRSGRGVAPRAYAFVTGPNKVAKQFSHGIKSSNVGVNNSNFCIRGIGFHPTHVQVTARLATDFPQATLNEKFACGGGTAIYFGGDVTYPEKFFIALWD
jgi:hypothetical protein